MINKILASILLTLSFFNTAIAISPVVIPDEFYASFTNQETTPVIYWYKDHEKASSSVYLEQMIHTYLKKARQRETVNGLKDTYLYEAFNKYPKAVLGKRIGVFGQSKLWYESVVLAFKAFPTSINYHKTNCTYPLIKTRTFEELDQNPQLFDALLAISVFETEGFGIYESFLDPDGDLKAMKRAKRLLKKNGLLFLSVPIGEDLIIWNLHRVYGPIRLHTLLEGWEIVDCIGYSARDENYSLWDYQHPVFVLRPLLD